MGFLVKFSPEDGIVWVNSAIDWSTYSIPRKARLTQGRIGLWEGGSTSTRIHLVDTETGQIAQTQTGWNSQAGNNLFYDANIQMLVNAHSNGIHQAWPGRATRDTVPLSAVVTSLCARVGLSEDDLDVAQLTDPVRGFSLARQVSIRGGLELLAVAYDFDGVESDFQLKFTKRGSSAIRVITQDELAYVSDPGSPLPELFGETRAQDVDLPARFTVRYNDIERDSDIGVQTVKRIVRPAATMQSQNEATLDLPLVLSAGEAKEIALRQGFAPWIERVHHQWRLPWTHIDIDPGDVVTIVRNTTAHPVTVTISGQSADPPVVLPDEVQLIVCNGTDVLPAGSTQPPYDVMLFFPGTQEDGQLLLELVFVRAVAFPEDLTGSEAYAGTAPAAGAVMKLLKNDVEVGTVTFAMASQTGTFDLSGGALFAAGDRLAVTAPATADASLADVALGLKGVRAS